LVLKRPGVECREAPATRRELEWAQLARWFLGWRRIHGGGNEAVAEEDGVDTILDGVGRGTEAQQRLARCEGDDEVQDVWVGRGVEGDARVQAERGRG
jgi:hypothetical protein